MDFETEVGDMQTWPPEMTSIDITFNKIKKFNNYFYDNTFYFLDHKIVYFS